MNCPVCIWVSMKSFRSLTELDPQNCIFFKNVHCIARIPLREVTTKETKVEKTKTV